MLVFLIRDRHSSTVPYLVFFFFFFSSDVDIMLDVKHKNEEMQENLRVLNESIEAAAFFPVIKKMVVVPATVSLVFVILAH